MKLKIVVEPGRSSVSSYVMVVPSQASKLSVEAKLESSSTITVTIESQPFWAMKLKIVVEPGRSSVSSYVMVVPSQASKLSVEAKLESSSTITVTIESQPFWAVKVNSVVELGRSSVPS